MRIVAEIGESTRSREEFWEDCEEAQKTKGEEPLGGRRICSACSLRTTHNMQDDAKICKCVCVRVYRMQMPKTSKSESKTLPNRKNVQCRGVNGVRMCVWMDRRSS